MANQATKCQQESRNGLRRKKLLEGLRQKAKELSDIRGDDKAVVRARELIKSDKMFDERSKRNTNQIRRFATYAAEREIRKGAWTEMLQVLFILSIL